MFLSIRSQACVSLLALTACLSPTAQADTPQKPLNSSTQTESNPVMEQAGLAAKLALLGEKKKSPILLVAAAELFGELTSSSKDTSTLVKESDDKAGSGELSSNLGFRDLLARAEEIAVEQGKAGKPTLDHIRSLSSRGIVFSQGSGKDEVERQGITFKVMDQDKIKAGGSWTYKKMEFEGGKRAIVYVVGDGDGDLDLYVYDANTGGLIGKDTDDDSTPVVQWTPRYEGPFRVVVRNAGGVYENYALLCNW